MGDRAAPRRLHAARGAGVEHRRQRRGDLRQKVRPAIRVVQRQHRPGRVGGAALRAVRIAAREVAREELRVDEISSSTGRRSGGDGSPRTARWMATRASIPVSLP
jgi:hypothetical protein